MTHLERMARQRRVAGAIEVPQVATAAGLAKQARAQMAQTTAVSQAKIARLQFADWLQSEMPQVFQVAAEQASAQATENAAIQSGLGQIDWGDIMPAPETVTPTKSTWEKFLDGAIGAGTAYLTLQNQKDILALNIERAKMGQPPLDAATTAPVVRTQIDIDPALAKSLMSDVGSTVSRNMLIIAGVGLAAILFLGRK